MKRLFFGVCGMLICGSVVASSPQALYVKKGNSYTKYNFGVAGNLEFFDGGHKLRISGYKDIIDLDNIDHISFNLPIDQDNITPYSQKQKMIEIGESVNYLVDQHSVGEMLRMVDAFFNHHEHDGKTYHPVCEYYVPKEYWDVHDEFRSMMHAMSDLLDGNPAGVRSVRAKSVNLYKASDYFGVYSADRDKEQWVKIAPADYLEIQYKGYDDTDYSVRLDCSSASTVWETVDFIGELPRRMDLSFSVNSVKVADAAIVSELVQDERILMDITFSASGYYKVSDRLDITDSLVTDNLELYVNGKKSITANTIVNGANLVNYDIMKDDVKEATHYHDEEGNCCGDDPEALISHFYRAETDVDVLGLLQVKAKALDFSRLYDSLKDDEEATGHDGYEIKAMNSDRSIITVFSVDKSYRDRMERLVDYLNDYTDAQFFYDGEDAMQGYVSFDQLSKSWNDYYYPEYYDDWAFVIEEGYLTDVYKMDGGWYYAGSGIPLAGEPDLVRPSIIRHEYYEVSPLLNFFDMTTYAFEDFFDDRTFTILIDDYEDIIDTYETITGQK